MPFLECLSDTLGPSLGLLKRELSHGNGDGCMVLQLFYYAFYAFSCMFFECKFLPPLVSKKMEMLIFDYHITQAKKILFDF